jgi:hypothetical protein
MTDEIRIGQGDSDDILVTLSDVNGVVNLSTADVIFVINDEFGTVFYEVTCTDNNSSGGTTLPLTDTETATAGTFYGQFIVTFSDRQATFPDSKYVKMTVLPKLTRPTGA